MYVLCRDAVAFIQGSQDIRIGGPHCAGVVVRGVDAAVGQTDIVNDAGDRARGKLLANGSFDEIAEASGLFDACACRGAQVKTKRAVVGTWEEIPPEPGNDNGDRPEAGNEK